MRRQASVVLLLAALSASSASAASAASAQTTPSAGSPARSAEPFTFADFSWLTGNPRTTSSPLSSEAFTGEFRVDSAFTFSFNRPQDHTIVGSSEIFRHGELQVTQLGVGGDVHVNNVRGRLMTQFGMYSQTTPRNDASPQRGQWSLDHAYRYVSEAYGGYHWDALHGVNLDAGIFMSYVGLWSYYQFDNWTYQPSYVSSNTPWFFNGVRLQLFPTEHLKIEPWVINGWQSYGMFNHTPGVGGQILWRPTGSVSVTLNNYWGADTLGTPDRARVHSDNSVQVKYYDHPDREITKAAFTVTVDAGCEYGGGVRCHDGTADHPAQYFLGFMAYHRVWLGHDRHAVTVGGGAITNPGRYLVLVPPINGATAASGTPYFTAAPGDPYRAWDAQATYDYMPSEFATFRAEFVYRRASVPYFSGAGGVTPPGGNTGTPGSTVTDWQPDLRRSEPRVTLALLVKF